MLAVPLTPIPCGDSQLSPTHPRLFFTVKELEVLKTKTKTVKHLWGLLLSAAEYHLEQRPSRVWDLSSAENAIYPAESLAFTFLMTGDEQYARKALEFVNAVIAWSDWIDPSEEIVDLGTSWTTLGVSTVYDWLYEYMNETQRSQIKAAIYQKGAIPIFQAATRSAQPGWPSAGWWQDRFHNNHASIAYGALGTAALALLGEIPEAESWLNLARKGIIAVLNSGGSNGGWGEGIHYWQYGLYPVVFFIDALRRVTGENLYQHPFLKETIYFPLYSLSRGGIGFLTFSDTFYRPEYPSPSLHREIGVLVARLASEYRDPYGQWLVETLLKQVGWMWKPWWFIWYDPLLMPRDPADLPLTRHFLGLGWVIMRTGWKPGDIMFAFKSGPIWNHGHADQNSFILEGYGERLVDDLGYGDPVHNPNYFGAGALDYHIASISHNTVLVNGQGQEDPRSSWRQLDEEQPPYMGGSIQEVLRFIGPDSVDCVLGNANRVYDSSLSEFRRQVVFLRPRFFILFDHIRANRSSVLEWLLHTTGEITVDHDTIYVRSGRVILAVRFLSPDDFSHQILRDQLISERFGEKPSTVAPYVKVTPQHASLELDFLVVLCLYLQGEEPPSVLRVERPDGFDVLVSSDGRNQTISFKKTGKGVYVGSVSLAQSGFSLTRNSGGDVVNASLSNGAALLYEGGAQISFSFLRNLLDKAKHELAQNQKALLLLTEAEQLYAAAETAMQQKGYSDGVNHVEGLLAKISLAYAASATASSTTTTIASSVTTISKTTTKLETHATVHYELFLLPLVGIIVAAVVIGLVRKRIPRRSGKHTEAGERFQ
jgi:hypothetical protein